MNFSAGGGVEVMSTGSGVSDCSGFSEGVNVSSGRGVREGSCGGAPAGPQPARIAQDRIRMDIQVFLMGSLLIGLNELGPVLSQTIRPHGWFPGFLYKFYPLQIFFLHVLIKIGTINHLPRRKNMSLYIQPYPFGRIARRVAAQPRERVLGVNVQEQDEAYVLSALVPGLKAEDLNIQVLENVVSIEGEYKAEEAEYVLSELPSGSFRRTLRLPAPIEADRVEARIADGVLTLTLPKAESARPKKIQVSVN